MEAKYLLRLYIVMEGGYITLEQLSRGGYIFKDETSGSEPQQSGHNKRIKTKKGSELVTFNKIWELDDVQFSSSTPQVKDLCFSFAPFKLLRRRFEKYTVPEAAGFTKARDFFLDYLSPEGRRL
jgi:hypothetical protein